MSHQPLKPGGIPFLRKIKPSYLVLLALVPLFIYLFTQNKLYKEAFIFILPGLKMTLALSISGYLLASVLGLLVAGMQFLVAKPRTLINYTVAGLILVAISLSLLRVPQNTYVLVGEATGTIAIIKNTPKEVSDPIRSGAYSETAGKRKFRAVPTAEIALERLNDPNYNYTAVLIPKDKVPADSNIVWEKSVMSQNVKNAFMLLLGLGVFTLLLCFGSWHSGEHPLTIFAELYIDLIRGIPMLVLIIFIGLILPGVLQKMNILFEPENEFLRNLQRGTAAIGLAYAAYMAEIFRAGIQAIPKGQLEAGRSIGLTGTQVVRFIILPQALKIVMPPLGNEFIAMLKDTAIISLIGAGELARKSREFGAAKLNNLPPYYTVSFIYVLLTLSASSILKWLEKRTNTEER